MKTAAFLGLRLNKSPFFLINNSRGQFAIETVLLAVVLLSLFFFVTDYARRKKLVSTLAEKPMGSVAMMTGYGVWKSKEGGCKVPGSSAVTIGKCHPNSIKRSLSSAPE